MKLMDPEMEPLYGARLQIVPENRYDSEQTPSSLARRAGRVALGLLVAGGLGVAVVRGAESLLQSEQSAEAVEVVLAPPPTLPQPVVAPAPADPKPHPKKHIYRLSAATTSTRPSKSPMATIATVHQPVPQLNNDYAGAYKVPLAAKFNSASMQAGGIEYDNKPYGYYLGRFPVYKSVKIVAETEQGDYLAVAVPMRISTRHGYKTVTECGWVVADAVNSTGRPTKDKHIPKCAYLLSRMADRYSFGHHFNSHLKKNGDDSSADGAKVTATAECNDVLYTSDENLIAQLAGATLAPDEKKRKPTYKPIARFSPNDTLYVRYFTLDNKMAAVRTEEGLWGDVLDECIPGHPKGGPPNHDREKIKQ